MTQQNNITRHSATDRSVHTEIIINAPIEAVWKELTDFNAMPTWSKSLQRVEGVFKKNEKVRVHFMDDKGKVGIYKHTLVYFEEGQRFGWSDSIIVGLKDNHTYALTNISENKTRLVNSDRITGISCLLVGNMAMNFMLKNYTEFNAALKLRIENK